MSGRSYKGVQQGGEPTWLRSDLSLRRNEKRFNKQMWESCGRKYKTFVTNQSIKRKTQRKYYKNLPLLANKIILRVLKPDRFTLTDCQTEDKHAFVFLSSGWNIWIEWTDTTFWRATNGWGSSQDQGSVPTWQKHQKSSQVRLCAPSLHVFVENWTVLVLVLDNRSAGTFAAQRPARGLSCKQDESR